MSVTQHNERDLRSFVVFCLCLFIVRTLMWLVPINESTLRRIKVLDDLAAKSARPVRGATVTKSEIADVPVERIVPAWIDDDRTAVLYLHGGAFIACGLDSHRPIAAALARELGVQVVNADYRQCPEAGVGTSVHDGYSVYRALRDSGDFDKIVVAGDSAGGYVSAKVVEYAARDGIAVPDAYIGFSPLLNISPDADRSSLRDAMLPIKKIEKVRPFYERGPEPLDGPLNTTVDAVARVFPPAVVICARSEALQKDATDLCAALDRAGVPNELHVYRGQVHAFPAAVTDLSQSRDAVRVSAMFVRQALAADAADDAASA